MSKLTRRQQSIIFSQRAFARVNKDGEINVIIHHRINENDAKSYIDGMIKFAEQNKNQSN